VDRRPEDERRRHFLGMGLGPGIAIRPPLRILVNRVALGMGVGTGGGGVAIGAGLTVRNEDGDDGEG
jgi:hypothetical protein